MHCAIYFKDYFYNTLLDEYNLQISGISQKVYRYACKKDLDINWTCDYCKVLPLKKSLGIRKRMSKKDWGNARECNHIC